MRHTVLVALFLLAALVSVRRMFLVTAVSGSSMEPALRSGDSLLVRRTKRVRAGQVVVFESAELMPARGRGARRSRAVAVKRAAAVPGDVLPADWESPDTHELAGSVIPPGSLVLLGDNRATSWDSRHHGLVPEKRLVGVVVRHLGTR